MLLLRWSGSSNLRTRIFFQILDFLQHFFIPHSSHLIRNQDSAAESGLSGTMGGSLLGTQRGLQGKSQLWVNEMYHEAPLWHPLQPYFLSFCDCLISSGMARMYKHSHVSSTSLSWARGLLIEAASLRSRGRWAGFTSRIEKAGNTLHQTWAMQEEVTWDTSAF